MNAATVPLTADQGVPWKPTPFIYGDATETPYDLTGASAVMEISDGFGVAPIVTLTELSGIALGGAAGTIAPELTVEQLALLTVENKSGAWPTKTYKYTLVVTMAGMPFRLMQGDFIVTRKIGAA